MKVHSNKEKTVPGFPNMKVNPSMKKDVPGLPNMKAKPKKVEGVSSLCTKKSDVKLKRPPSANATRGIRRSKEEMDERREEIRQKKMEKLLDDEDQAWYDLNAST